jgi:multidrug resistance efflux pump
MAPKQRVAIRLAAVGLVAALAAGFYAWSRAESPVQAVHDSDGPRLRREPFERRQLLSGELVAERAIDIRAPEVGSRALEVRRMVDNGSQVQAGDLLMAFDNSELAATLEEQKIAVLAASTELVTTRSQTGSNLAAAEFEVERRQAAFEQARLDAAIPRELKSAEEYARLQLEQRRAESRLADARSALAAAEAVGSAQRQLKQLALEKAQSELMTAEVGIDDLQVVAPAAGVALVATNPQAERRWRVGDVAYPGALLVTLPDLQSLIVRARLFDVDDGLIEPGAPAAVILDPFPDTVIAARVRHVDSMALQSDKKSSSRIFWVTVDLETLDLERMRPGMSAKVVVGAAATDLGALPDHTAPDAAGRRDPLIAPRASLDLSDPQHPRLLLADGSWTAVDLGPCDPLRCVVEDGAMEGTRLGWVAAAGSDR